MASTYTDSNGIEKPATGEQSGTWGDTVNTNMDLLDEAMEGQVTVTLPSAGTTGSPNSFAIADGSTSPARHRFVTFSDSGDLGGTAYVQLTPNNASKLYFAKNSLSSSRAVVLFQGTYNAGRAVQINNGETYLIAFDGGGGTATCTKIGEIPTATGSIASQDSDDIAVTGGTISGVTGAFPTLSSPSVTITGGTITGITDLAVADGGTAASTAAGARANLGLAIGSDVQAHDANLDQIAALTPTDSSFIVGNGSAWVAESAATALASLGITASAAEINNLDGITPAGAALLDDANAAAQRTTLGIPDYVTSVLPEKFIARTVASSGSDTELVFSIPDSGGYSGYRFEIVYMYPNVTPTGEVELSASTDGGSAWNVDWYQTTLIDHYWDSNTASGGIEGPASGGGYGFSGGVDAWFGADATLLTMGQPRSSSSRPLSGTILLRDAHSGTPVINSELQYQDYNAGGATLARTATSAARGVGSYNVNSVRLRFNGGTTFLAAVDLIGLYR